ncbi:Predicted kinase, aminoglycoside phosphotransferase (APT) family [Sphingobium faniae]|nr:Predicted kinase, aminoglycoside phosphotransferase (APT) family [Sphingobium faniae]
MESQNARESRNGGHDDALALLAAVQSLLTRVQAEEGDRLSRENTDLLRRATAGLGWVRATWGGHDDPALSTDTPLEREHRARQHLARHVSGDELKPDSARQTDIPRPAPTAQALTAAICASTGHPVAIESIAPIWTETSKEIFAVACSAPGWPREAILRREPPIAVVATSLVDEYDVLQLAHDAGLPVPRPLFAEADPNVLEGRVLLLERVHGQAQGVAKIGAAGPAIAADMAAFLARLHALDPNQVPRLRSDGQSIADRLAQNIAKAREDCAMGDQSPLVMAAFDWLDAHFDECVTEVPAIVHGDFDLRNILIENGRLSAVLDWELSVRGHPAQDLGYAWPHVTQISQWDDFMAAYRAAGGRPIPLRQVLFFAIWSQLWRIAVIVPLWRAFYRGEHAVLLLGSLRYLEQQVYLDDLARAFNVATSLD